MIARSTAVRSSFALAAAAVLATSGCAAGRDAQTANQVPTQDGANAMVGAIALRSVSLAAPPSGAVSYRPGSAVSVKAVLVNSGTHDEQLTNIVTTVARGWAAYRTRAQARQVIAAQSSGARQLPGSSGPSASTTPGTTPSNSDSTSPSGSGTPSGSGSGSSGATNSSSSSSTSASATASASATGSSSSSTPVPQTSVTIPAGQRVSFDVPDSQRVLLLRSSVGSSIQSGATVKITFTFSRSGSVTVAVPVRLSSDPDFATITAGSTDDEGN